VVGDAQVFGLGVEEREAFAAALERAIGAPVMNGGVPTYGPPEYHQVIAEQLVKRHPKTVIIALNLADDLFELDHRDRDRNAVSDGWAVARAKAPAEIREFPGRELMFRRSHLWFAIEKAHNDAEPGGSTDDITGEPPAVPDAPWNALVTAGELGRAPGTDPPLGAYLRDVKQLVSGAGARLVVVILPLDVQVSPAAWPHHHTRPVDLAPSQAFTAALVELCHTIGVAVLDATPVLVAAGPGAFQDRASLLAPPGHAALAAALAHTLAEPPAN
jgi:hypothetical protein